MTYTIHRYPVELIDVVHLAGERVTIRPVLPQDADLMQAFFRTLSDRSRRNRFFRTLRELPRHLIDQFTSLDYHAHFALMATVVADGAEVVIGEARYVVAEAGAAEFAVAVADDWHGRGLGRMLLSRLLCRAASEGLDRLFGDVLAGNEEMRRLARKLGLTVRPGPPGLGLMKLEARLDSPSLLAPCIDAARVDARRAA